MTRSLHDHLSLPTLPTGRRLYALHRIRALLTERPSASLLAVVDAATALDDAAWALERRWASRSTTAAPAPGESPMELDRQLDSRWAALHRALQETWGLHGAGTEPGDAARALLDAVFPGGVSPLVSLTHAEQQVANGKALEALRTPDLAQDLATLRLEAVVDGLADLHARFTAAMAAAAAAEASAVTWDEVVSARDAGREALARVVVHALVEADGDPEARAALLAPVWRQVDALRKSRRGRRVGMDLDPATGEEVETVEAAEASSAEG